MRLLSALTVILFIPATFAQGVPYADITSDMWFYNAVDLFIQEKYLDESKTLFRGADRSTRAEFTKLIVELNGGILDETPSRPSFTDVSPGDWFHAYMEEAAREGWVLGDGNCYGKLTCFVRPHDSITRAEAAVLVTRAFGKKRTNGAPGFSDNPNDSWFYASVQTAADHCIVRRWLPCLVELIRGRCIRGAEKDSKTPRGQGSKEKSIKKISRDQRDLVSFVSLVLRSFLGALESCLLGAFRQAVHNHIPSLLYKSCSKQSPSAPSSSGLIRYFS